MGEVYRNMTYRPRTRVFASVLLGATALASAPVWAQTAPPAQPAEAASDSETDQSTEVDEVVVTGFRQSYANAIAAKRREVSITDGISSDGLGRFPDLNVGEALQRIPGVQLNREAEGRNATINLRGLPGEYSRLTMNGVAFAEPILRESAPLGAFNSDIFSAIVVNKSPLADAQSGGLSGNVDLQIARALGRTDGGFTKAAVEYNELGETTSPAATIGYNHHFTDDFAAFGVLAYRQENFRRDSILFNSYAAFTPAQAEANAGLLGSYYARSAACPSCTGTTSTAGVLYDAQHRQYVRLNEGELVTGAVGAEWRVANDAKIGLTGFYSDRNLPNTAQYLLITSNNLTSRLTANTAPVRMADGRFVVEDFSFSNPDMTSSSRAFSQHQKVMGINLTGDWENDDWRVAAIGALSQAENDSVEISVDFQTLQTAAGNGVTGRLVTGGDDIARHIQTLAPNPVFTTAGISTGVWGGTGAAGAFFDNANVALRRNRFNFQGTQTFGTNQLFAGKVDVERMLDGPLSAVQVGIGYESSEFDAEGYRIIAYGLPIQNVTPDFLQTAPFATDFMGGSGGNPTQNWQIVDLERAISALRPVTVFPGGELSPTGYNINYANNAYQLDNFTNRTDLWSTYAQLKYDFDLGGVTLRGNAGLRYEVAVNEIDALTRVSLTNVIGVPSDFRSRTYSQDYDKLLPSFILLADITDDFVIRAAAYKSYVRPQPLQFSPSTVVSAPNNGVYSVTLGNPNLKPYDAESFDISAEWYNRADSIVSLAGFQKEITGLIATITDPTKLCPADGGGLGIGTLRINGDRCESSLTYTDVGGVTQPFLVAASGFTNQPNPITVRGVELNVQQSLDFLPGLWSHFGGGFNYAYTTISGKTLTGADATLPGVSEHNVNLVGYYETDKYGVRLVYNWRNAYDLASTASFTGAARQVRARGQLDLSASYNINDFVSVSFDAYNLTNSIRVEYENQLNMPRKADYDGRTYTATLRTTF
jgi:TonB-dependent receptor